MQMAVKICIIIEWEHTSMEEQCNFEFTSSGVVCVENDDNFVVEFVELSTVVFSVDSCVMPMYSLSLFFTLYNSKVAIAICAIILCSDVCVLLNFFKFHINEKKNLPNYIS